MEARLSERAILYKKYKALERVAERCEHLVFRMLLRSVALKIRATVSHDYAECVGHQMWEERQRRRIHNDYELWLDLRPITLPLGEIEPAFPPMICDACGERVRPLTRQRNDDNVWVGLCHNCSWCFNCNSYADIFLDQGIHTLLVCKDCGVIREVP